MTRKFVIFGLLVIVLLFFQHSRADDSLTLLATLSGVAIFNSAGDVNSDGFNDIIAGHSVGYDGRGCAKIYFGGTDFDTIPDVIMIGEEKAYPLQEYTSFGSSVASAGDVNKDGYDDVIVGAPTAETGWGLWAGKAYIFLGGSEMDTTADVVMEGKGWYNMLGDALSPAGDVNGDGFDDVIVAAPHDDYDARGRAYIFLGAQNMDNVHDIYIEGQDGDFCGYSVAGIGDINGDGFDDVLVGYPHIFWEPFEGKASIFFGGSTMDSIPDITFKGDSALLFLGGRVASAGDANADSFPDIVISGGKKVKLFYGGSEMDTVTDVEFTGEPVLPTNFGYSISSAGDLNKDGFDDIMISDYDADRVYIFFGSSDVDTIPDVILDKPELIDRFGYHVSGLGDINGDGYNEIAVCPFIYTSNPTCVDQKEESNTIQTFYLEQNYPNPFNAETVIEYELPENSQVKLSIYNILGQHIKTLIDGYQKVGINKAVWNGKDQAGRKVSSGVYFYRLKAGEFTQTRKMLLIR